MAKRKTIASLELLIADLRRQITILQTALAKSDRDLALAEHDRDAARAQLALARIAKENQKVGVT